jgi:hypothetical protein
MSSEVTGYNANRRIFEEGTEIGEEIESIRGTMPLPVFQIAVVVDVFCDPSKLTAEDISKLQKETASPELCKRMPRNSITGRIITRNQDLFDSSPKIFFPVDIFDAGPVKPGEQVFVFYIDQNVNDQIGYWWKRVPQTIDTDDINFTHADRKFEINEGATATDKLAGKKPAVLDFKNGGIESEQRTLAGANAYDKINKNAKANAEIIKEPTARFTKRPGDNVILGSNATRIVLGMDRASSSTAPASTPPREKSATIDMVVGYGRKDKRNAPKIIENSRGYEEVDKDLKTPSNVAEGDPDMVEDPSRFYLSESTDPDTNFEIEIEGITPPAGNAPSAIIKTDRLRLIGNQNIRIVGKSSSVSLEENGDMALIAPNIKIGSTSSEEPIVLGNSLVKAIANYVKSTTDALNNLNIAAATYFAIPVAIGVPTPPQQATFITAWSTYYGLVLSAQATLEAELNASLSTKVFSE